MQELELQVEPPERRRPRVVRLRLEPVLAARRAEQRVVCAEQIERALRIGDRRRVDDVRAIERLDDLGIGVGDAIVRMRLGGNCKHERQHRQRDQHPADGPVARPPTRSYGALVPASLTENSLAVLRARYLARDHGVVVETPEQLFRRVSTAVAGVERLLGYSDAEIADAAARFERMMSELEFLPNSPTLMNAGRPLGQLAACFVVPVDDSTTGVFQAVGWAAEIQKTGGGTGFSFSRLRPAGDIVASTGQHASGPVSLMQVFDVATEAIKQGGTRRGANMGMLRVDHPDILEFIAIKLDPTRMKNFNLSVAATDEFMAAARAGRSYDLRNPRSGEVVGSLDAHKVLDAIANAAWACGDPGMVFIDRVNEEHPARHLGRIESTNPCVVGDTRVHVAGMGLVPIRELVGALPRVATLEGDEVVFRPAAQVVRTGVRPVLALTTVEGHALTLTADHRVTTARGDVPAGELVPGDRVRLALGPVMDPDLRESRLGALAGMLTRTKGFSGQLAVSERDLAILREYSIDARAEQEVPEAILRGGDAVIASYLRTVMPLRGPVTLLRGVQQLLLAHGELTRIEDDRLLLDPDSEPFATVAALEPEREVEVFDLSEPSTLHFAANGLVVHNCGEVPLLPFEACNLGSIDVGRFVRDRDLDWPRLAEIIRDATRFLDDVIDANKYPLPEIERATKSTRKIGLGVMGWADALAALGIAYDSAEALALAHRLAEFLEVESLAASTALAERRGAFPAWAGSRWDEAGHSPLRNATTTTIAPTGTISIIAGCASGIEPLYALVYRRNVLDGAVLSEVNPAFQRAMRGADAALLERVAEHGGARGIEGIPDDVQRRFPTAHEVPVDYHVRMQAAFQRHVHAAVSKTINLRREATPADVKAAYELAYELGCKGITVYRDGSREGQVLVTGARPAAPVAAPHCPECGALLVVQQRCQLCRSCGWSVCT